MVANIRINEDYSRAEKFFTSKILELTYHKTLDSYRARLHNPHTVLIEFEQVLSDFNEKKIKHFDKTIRPVCHEVERFIKEPHHLQFGYIHESYFLELLTKADEKNYHELWHAVRVIARANQEYGQRLFTILEKEIERLNKEAFELYEFENLSRLTNFTVSELISYGISKGYIYQAVSKCFNEKMKLPFAESLGNLASLLTRSEEEYSIIFKISSQHFSGNFKTRSDAELNGEEIAKIKTINSKANQFLSKQRPGEIFLRFVLPGKDYLSVIETAKRKLFAVMDILNLGYPDKTISVTRRCLVIGTRKPELTNTQPLVFSPDGSYQNSEVHHLRFLSQIRAIENNRAVQKEARQKLISGYRYLRLGRDAIELEQKFINYWIGLEYLFSNYDITDTTIARLKEGFTNAHSISYIRRNLQEFHKDIKRLHLAGEIADYSDSLKYLLIQNTFDVLMKTQVDKNPLLAFRAYKLKQNLFSKERLCQKVKKHRQNLEWHLVRCYRIRNEIVHDAAIHLGIEAITSNLKYYLTFILNSLIDYLASTPFDMDHDSQISIEDYLILQRLKYKSLEKSGFDLDTVMAEKSATELFVY